MNRNEKTTIDRLANGDRFYFLADKTKTVWQKVDKEAKQTNYQTYRYWALLASIAESAIILNPMYIENNIKAVNKETPIVYLRSTGIIIEQIK